MRTTDRRRKNETCELCGRRLPGEVKSREIPIGGRMVKRRVCPSCAKAASEISHAAASEEGIEGQVQRTIARERAQQAQQPSRINRKKRDGFKYDNE